MVDCKTCEYEKICEMPDFIRNDIRLCKTYKEKKPQTNDDRINHMSAEEKAEWLFEHDRITAEKGRLSKEELLQWLKSEAKE